MSIGLIITLALSIVGALAADGVQGTLSFALIGVLLTLMWELMNKVSDVSKQGFGKLEDYEARWARSAQLLDRIYTLPEALVGPELRRLDAHLNARLVAQDKPVYARALAHRMEMLGAWLDEVVEGRLTLDNSFRGELLLEAARNCNEILRGVTRGEQTLEWWCGTDGQEYERLNLDAVKRSTPVRVIRVFVGKPRPPRFLEMWRKLVLEQVEAGIDVWFIDNDEAAALGPVNDMTIFDDRLLHKVVSVCGGDPLEVLYSVKPQDIADQVALFKRLLSRAHKLDASSPLLRSDSPHAPRPRSTASGMEELLRNVFVQAMPPAFIKRWDHERTETLIESAALGLFQVPGASEQQRLAWDPEVSSILADHAQGDQQALLRGVSRQLELVAVPPGGRPKPVLTTKTRIESGRALYIAGWYVPVDSLSLPSSRGDLFAREESSQVVCELREVGAGAGLHITIGESLRSLMLNQSASR
ncbi:hypothetical protein [Motilibacter deserti]|uniref:Uncharacterized protein n=1 Tax=Motilibacter deserti TaxID=2714956 RepID=A0ABX0H3Y5_9ACTN|nr:hypothetical protein [Motilibacter deserti]NHC16113.1 hypothetical protein [Motilibacter deserti]